MPAHAASAAIKDSETTLPLTGFSDMVVDAAHQQVFVTGSGNDSEIQVLDFQGNIIGAVPNESQARGIALDASTSTLYVALASASVIDKIDTVSLQRTGSISIRKRAYNLALVGGRLWFGFNCAYGLPGVASVDLDGTHLTQYSGDFPKYCAGFATSPTDPTVLAMGELSADPTKLWVYRVADNPPTLLAESFNPGGNTLGLGDMVISPDGLSLLTASYEPDRLQVFRLSDLTLTSTYPTGPHNISVATTADGSFVAGGIWDIAPQVNVFPSGSPNAVLSIDFGPSELKTFQGSLAFSPDSSRLFAVSTSGGFDPIFHVIDGPTLDASTLSLAGPTDPVLVGDPVALSGALSFPNGGALGGKLIHMSRVNPDGSTTALPDAITDISGDYSATDTLPTIGTYSYAAVWDGDQGHRGSSASDTVEGITHPATTADFNGDGFSDIAIGAPGETLGTAVGAGAVNVIYGSSTGLDSTGNQLWTQNKPDVLDTAESGDAFGFAVAAGDFNRDGFADLAVGVPGEEVAAITDSGVVEVLYGSSDGLTAVGNQLWSWESLGQFIRYSDAFGSSLAAGDANGDGFFDLAIGVPSYDAPGILTEIDAGAVTVLYGSATGLSDAGHELWTDTPEAPDFYDAFGFALAFGDFNADGYADLVASSPGEYINGAAAGAVSIIPGSASGLTSTGSQFWNQDSPDINDKAEEGDSFGFSVATGDINGDGYADLAVGVPFENVVYKIWDAGAVNMIYGSASGLTATNDQRRTQDSADILDSAEANDHFGFSVAIGDFDGDGFADLAVGVPGEDLAQIDAGAVNVIYGASTGVTSTANQLWDQGSPNINDKEEEGDGYGYTVIANQFGNGSQADLAAGVPFEDVGTKSDAGALSVIYGSPTNLTSTADDYWNQNSADIEGIAEPYDEFGFGLDSEPGNRPGFAHLA